LVERRLVTVLFADLVGFTTRSERQDPEEVASFLSDYFERSRAVIDHFGGVVDKYAGDAVMAAWGAHIANEDDAERAVRAALELQQTVAKLAADAGDPDITLRVGVHTGEAAVKPGGNQSTGMIVGDLVNSAARLQTAAEPGTVLVGEATYLAARDAIAFEAAGTPELKGKREPIPTWRALRVVAERRGSGRVQGLDPPFVGRRDELQLLKDLFTGVERDGRARMVSIVGEVGIGKARLAWELQKYADGVAAPVFWNHGRSSAYGTEGVASRALSDMLRGRIGVTENDDDATVLAALDDSLDQFVGDVPDRKRLRQWLGALLCCGQSPDGDRAEFDAAIRNYFAHMATKGTTVLVFEDLQWADAELLDLVEQLADWLPDAPVLVLALTRPQLLERRPAWTAGRRGVVSLRLGPLSDEEMGQLIEGMMGELEPRLRSHIIDRAAGVPLYAVELVRSLMGRGLIASVDGKSTALTDVEEIAVPATLQSLIGARIDRLDSQHRSLLQDAAVLGNVVTPSGLAAISGRSESEVTKGLDGLVHQELVEPVRDPRSALHGGFRFVQELVREVGLSRMSRDVRRARHVAAARYVESLGGPDDAVVAADHYLSALEVTAPGSEADALRGRAADVLMSALSRASTLYANEAVLSLGSRIFELDLDLPPERRVAINEEMAAAAGALLRFDEAQTFAEDAMALSRRRGDVTGVRRGAALSARINLESLKTGYAIELVEEQLDGVDDLTADPELARLAGLLARAWFLDGDYDAALIAADRALLAAEELQLVPVIGEALVTKATIYGIQGRIVESRLLLESVINLAKGENLTELALRAYLNLGAIIPDDDLTADPTLEAIELGRSVGNLNITLLALTNRAGYLMVRGRWSEAEEALRDPLWQSAAGAYHAVDLVLLGMNDALQGHTAAAEAKLRQGREAFGDEIDAQRTIGRDANEAVVSALIGNTSDAMRWALRVLDDAESVRWIEPLARVLLSVGERRQVEELAAACRARRATIDLRQRGFVLALVEVRPGDAASLAPAEALITDAAAKGLVVDEVGWTIGLARWLPEGDGDRARLMSGARRRIEETGLGGFGRFLDS
jgi:class 3 adenylate cyclase/tetratricopeptide (TPR) repeat protein